MILNVANLFGGFYPCRCLDANGLEWTLVYECDTETGRIERFVPHPETGKPYSMHGENSACRQQVFAAAPLLLIPLEKPC